MAATSIKKLLRIFWAISPAFAADATESLFDRSRVQDIRLSLSAEDWQSIRVQEDNVYYSGSFQWRDIKVSGVEIRQKGHATRNPYKPSLKIKFPKTDRPLGIKALELKSNVGDASQMKQTVTMAVFDRLGLPSQRGGYVRLWVNGEYIGVYQTVETINSDYLARVYPNDGKGGILYDFGPDPPYNFEYLGNDPTPYLYNFQLEEPDQADPTRLVEFIQAINQTPDNQFAATMDQFLDRDAFLTYYAIECYLGEADGLTGVWTTNNFYLYLSPKTKKFTFLVTDRDSDFYMIDEPLLARSSQNVLIRRALADPDLRNRFRKALLRVMAMAGGDRGWMQQLMVQQADVLRDMIYGDPNKRCDFEACTIDQYETQVAYMLAFAALRPFVAAQELPTIGEQPAQAPSIFETALTLHRGAPSVIAGERLANGAVEAGGVASSTLGGTRVWVNGFPAVLLSVSPGQILFLTPDSPGNLDGIVIVQTVNGFSNPLSVRIEE